MSDDFIGILMSHLTVLTVYSKGGGNHGRHGWVSDVSTITAASNIAVQVYQYQGFGIKFCDKPLMSHAFPQLFCFDILPSSSFLCDLSATPTSVEGGLQISNEDIDLFKKLKAQPKKISKAIKAFKTRKGVGANAESGGEEDDSQ